MEQKIIGTDLKVSAVGLGCMGFSHAYGFATDEREAIESIRYAYDVGYTFFDTAQCYLGSYPDGSISYNEELVGKALKDIRNHVVIATKFGVSLKNGTSGYPMPDSRPEFIRKSVDESLEKLQVDTIDLYFQHRIDPKVPAEEKNATQAQISLAWMMCKKPWIVPIPGSRKLERIKENAGSAKVVLSNAEIIKIDNLLNTMQMSEVFGGTKR